MTIRYESSGQRPNPNQTINTLPSPEPKPQPQNQPCQSPSRNQKRHQRIPSQPIQLSNSKTKTFKRRPMKTAPSPVPHQPTASSVERLLQPTHPGCQQDVIYHKPKEKPHFRPQTTRPGDKKILRLSKPHAINGAQQTERRTVSLPFKKYVLAPQNHASSSASKKALAFGLPA
jgi:hypothetical protein